MERPASTGTHAPSETKLRPAAPPNARITASARTAAAPFGVSKRRAFFHPTRTSGAVRGWSVHPDVIAAATRVTGERLHVCRNTRPDDPT